MHTVTPRQLHATRYPAGMRYTLAAATAVMLATFATGAQAQVIDNGEEESTGWWVVLGAVAHDHELGHGAALSDQFFLSAERCGVKSFTAKSRQFYTMRPGYTVVVSGPFDTEMKARAVLAQSKLCAHDAYLLHSTYSGE